MNSLESHGRRYYLLLDIIKTKLAPQKPRLLKLINELYKRYPNGFYVHAETKMDSAKKAAEYIGRYLARPAIAEYRIIRYDGKEKFIRYNSIRRSEGNSQRYVIYLVGRKGQRVCEH